MSIAAQLAQNDAKLHDATVRLLNMCTHASASDISEDPNYKRPEIVSSKSEYEGLSIYQLNADLQDTESAIGQLNALWLTKSLIHEIRTSINPMDHASYLCDKDELHAILQSLKKLKARVATLASEDLAISPALQSCSHDLIREFSSRLKSLLALYIPDGHDSSFVIRNQITVNDSSLAFADYVKIVQEFENFAATHDITEELAKRKPLWDKSILDRLILREKYINISVQDSATEIMLVPSLPARRFLSREYFLSLRSFVAFINILNNQSFKNYYLTKISNNLVEVVSENIKMFMDNKQQLTEELVETLDFISKSEWSMPIRNTFNSLDKIQEGLLRLYVGWVTDKYINEVREIFNSPNFVTNLTLLKDAIEESKQNEAVDSSWNSNATVEDSWSESWSDEEEHEGESQQVVPEPQRTPKKAPQNVEVEKKDEWSENWDSSENWDDDDNWEKDGWDDDWGETSPKKAKTTKSQASQAVSLSSNISIMYSQLPFKFSVILAKFAKESDNGDPHDILDTIGSLALLSYPPLTELFLLLNDLQRIKDSTSYLSLFAEEKWNHVKVQLFDEITSIITGIDFTNRDLTPDYSNDEDGMSLGSKALEKLVGAQFNNHLPETNTELFKVFVMELLNFINNLILEIIIHSDEITEYQSEKFTEFLQSLQLWEGEFLAKVGEDVSKLATYSKTKQAVVLINNHLKDIMEQFYQGDLFDFSTDELIKVIKSVFVPSDLRESCIGEIIEIRNS